MSLFSKIKSVFNSSSDDVPDAQTIYFKNGEMYKVYPTDKESWYDARYLVSDGVKYDLENLDDVKVMQIYTIDELAVADNSGVNNATIAYCGGVNVGESNIDASSETAINMEQVYSWNPEVILLSNFDDVVPEDLYNNTIDGQDWSQVEAVKNHRVYKIPQGIYRWDADCPCTETTLCMKWMAKVINPEVFKDIDIRQDTKDFYKNFFNYDLTDEELDTILATEANASSESIY